MKLKRISFMRAESRFGHADSDLPNLADMLRYDVAFQCNENQHLIAFPVFSTKHGNLGGQITEGRWHSFGVLVKNLPDEADAALNIHCIFKEQWITYRHPRKKDGPFDYTKLVPVTLQAYCDAKDIPEIAEVVEW